MNAPPNDKAVTLRAPDGTSAVQTVSGRMITVHASLIEVSDEEGRPLVAAGFVRVSG
jgi:hypothetical protein